MLFSIFTTGRTGSVLAGINLSSYYNIPFHSTSFIYDMEPIKTSGVIHNHNPLWVPGHNIECTAVISKRRNLFNSIISSFVATHTKEVGRYTGKLIEPFYVDHVDFEHRCVFERAYYKIIDTTKFDKIVEVYYEDMIADKKYLFSQFDIEHDMSMTVTTKSPYNNRELISNICELESLFDELLSRPLTEAEINNTRNSVIDDIIQARSYFAK